MKFQEQFQILESLGNVKSVCLNLDLNNNIYMQKLPTAKTTCAWKVFVILGKNTSSA